MWFRRKEVPWEVVDHKSVEQVPMYDEDEEIDVVRMSDNLMSYTYMHDIHNSKDMQNAIRTARYFLMQNMALKHYNILVSEGWRVTILRKGKSYRVEVTYSGRPAYAIGKLESHPAPPFMEVLEFYRRDLAIGCTSQR
ncbi:hypothetical protein C8Q75DRAFT_808812 [Abortiporus biennis]|nr:hypothetical protein C8Q75DRAFT_808812 [Abortiporus biennis]